MKCTVSNASGSATKCGDKGKNTVASRQCLNVWNSLVGDVVDTLQRGSVEMQACVSTCMQQFTCQQGCKGDGLTLKFVYHPAICLQGCCLHHWCSLPSHIHTEALVALPRNVMPECLLTSSGHAIKQTSATSKRKQVQHVRHVSSTARACMTCKASRIVPGMREGWPYLGCYVTHKCTFSHLVV